MFSPTESRPFSTCLAGSSYRAIMSLEKPEWYHQAPSLGTASCISASRCWEVKHFLPYRWVGKKCHSSLRFQLSATNVSEGSPKGTQCLRSSRCLHPPWWLPRSRWRGNAQQPSSTSPGEQGVKDAHSQERGVAPDSWGAYEKNAFRGWHLPPHRRTLNSLTWYMVLLCVC